MTYCVQCSKTHSQWGTKNIDTLTVHSLWLQKFKILKSLTSVPHEKKLRHITWLYSVKTRLYIIAYVIWHYISVFIYITIGVIICLFSLEHFKWTNNFYCNIPSHWICRATQTTEQIFLTSIAVLDLILQACHRLSHDSILKGIWNIHCNHEPIIALMSHWTNKRYMLSTSRPRDVLLERMKMK